MKRENLLYVIIAGLIIALVTMFKCEGDTNTTTKITTRPVDVEIPAHQGEFKEPTSQEELPPKETDTVYLEGKPIYLQSPVNEQLKKDLEQAKGFEQKYYVLLDANRKREYSSNFEDEFVKINAKSKIFGKLDSLQLTYTLKPRTVQTVETTIEKTIVKTDNFGVVVGGGYIHNLDTRKDAVEANAGIRLKKVTLLGGINTNKELTAKLLIEL